MEIVIFDGKENVMIKGGERSFDLCFSRKRKGHDVWEAEKYFTDLGALFDELLKRKIRHSDARSLTDLKDTFEKAKAELMEAWSCNKFTKADFDTNKIKS